MEIYKEKEYFYYNRNYIAKAVASVTNQDKEVEITKTGHHNTAWALTSTPGTKAYDEGEELLFSVENDATNDKDLLAMWVSNKYKCISAHLLQY